MIANLTNSKLLEKYSIENLSQTDLKPGEFSIKKEITKTDKYTSYLFEFEFDPDLDGKIDKTTTGQINIPVNTVLVEVRPLPIILMFRGYVNQETYVTGDGTRNAAKYFAENGFITVAPDFLGYGGSDEEAGKIFESRFQTYVTAVSLLKTLEQLNINPELVSGPTQLTQSLNHSVTLFLWGHSNGGQIALTTLEITGVNYPTTLWAPVSKMFPYSVLYYTDQSDDHGKLIRRELSEFEKGHDVDKYSLDLYLDKINAPIQIHQGMKDDAIPLGWTNELVIRLKELQKEVTYFTYPQADHNMQPNWDEVIQKDLDFYLSHIY